MKLKLNAVTITYTKSLTFIPTEQMFSEWGEVPTQKEFEDYAIKKFDVELYKEVRQSEPRNLTIIKHPNSFEINYQELEEVKIDSSIFDEELD